MTRECTVVAYHGIFLTPSLQPGEEEQASRVLAYYYRPTSGKKSGFTGGAWDTFDPSGLRTASLDIFTADDLVSASLLSAEIDGRPALELLLHQRERFGRLLQAIGPDRDLVDEPDVGEREFSPAWDLWRALLELPGLGPTRASKLMARKRPGLIPVFDTVIDSYVLGGTGEQWIALHHALNADDKKLHRRLVGLRRAASVPEVVSPLRVLDVLAWMDGTGNTRRLMSGFAGLLF